MITLVDAEKTFSKIQQLNDKNYQKKKKRRTERNFIKLIKNIYEKPV